ncbi:transglutaminase-like superfamily protein [Ruminiclostridium hungatei]|uniref:Transglutaminase-like superfamily protein n=1 Tax=Ruminiclostridium hungatei TaxID=48256 RepID=A0A1V4SMD7_RUMHU|nr:Tox-REase-5 domain-containing protein [Ruminiclostridium hungatei]OPX44391.1 transglutaminase-like superfamily protein [Ruminiclostridium hungatei]
MTYKKPVKIIAMVLLVAFSVTFGLPTQQLAQARQQEQAVQAKKAAPAVRHEKPSAQTKLGSFAEELNKWYEKLKADVAGNDFGSLKADVKSARKALQNIRKDINTELSNNEKTLKRLSAKKAQGRHDIYKTQINTQLDEFSAIFEKLDSVSAVLNKPKSKDIDRLKEKIEEIGGLLNPEQPQQTLGALPYDNVVLEPPVPSTGAGAAGGYTGTSAGTEPVSLPKVPTQEDLAETGEIQFSDNVKNIADGLSTVVEIYEYVKNNVDFIPYYGSRKGAGGTLGQMAGNDFDQASLLISMLRYKGIPSRYVRGTVEIPIERVKEWTGAETEEAAVRILGATGIPSVALVSGGVISAVRIEHVWVQAYVPYENYRGVGKGTGKKMWIPLDASFKEYVKKEGLDVEGLTGVSRQEIENAFTHTGTVSSDKNALSRISTDTLQQKLEEQKLAIEEYLSENNIEAPQWTDIFGGYEIISQELGLLPLTLPYKTVAVLGEYQSIGSEFKDTITFSISGADPYGLNFAGGKDFEYTSEAWRLYGKKLTLSWIPATPEDEVILKQYGGVFKTPAYMVQLKPVLKADGTVVAAGKAVGMGYRQQFTITLKIPGQAEPEKISNAVTAGSYYCVGLDYDKIAPDELKDISEKLQALKASINEQNIYSDEAMGEILNGVAKTYFAQLDIYNKMLESQFGVKASRLLSEGITGYNADVKYLFMTPVELAEGSMYIDVDRDVHSVMSINGDRDSEKAFMLAAGIMASSMEHAVFEQMFNTPSVSTIKILGEANRMGIPVYTIDKSNISSVLPKLEVSGSVRTDISNAVNSGRTVTIPQRNIHYFDWSGTGYVVLNPETGAAGYMISGGTAGGSMSIKQMLMEYVEGVIAGVLLMVMLELAEALAVALIPGAGWVAAVFMGIKLALVAMYVYNVITIAYMYFATGDSYYLQELIVQLAVFATLGLISKPLSSRISENITMLEQMARSEDAYYRYTADRGYSRETATDYYQKSGTKGLEEAQNTLDAFKKENVSKENVADAGKNLDSDGIKTYKDIIEDNSGKFDNADQTKVLDILKQCENKAEMESLRSNVDDLAGKGIEPGEYDSLGLNSPERVSRVEDALDPVDGVPRNELTEVTELVRKDLKSSEPEVALREDTEGGVLANSYTDAGVDTSAPTYPSLSGSWHRVNESMSAYSREYQTQITGKTGEAWIQNGVKYDGMREGTLLDAKAKYNQFVDKNTGRFYDWFKGKDALVNEATRQIAASEGAPVKWYFAEKGALDATRILFAERGIEGIELIFQPKD